MAITNVTPRTIHLGGPAVQIEKDAAEAVTPGHLVEIDTSGDYQKHASSTGIAQPAFAVEDAQNNVGYDTDYTLAARMQIRIGAPGSTFWAWLVSGQDVNVGEKLASAGDGMLTDSDTNPVVFAIEDKDASAGSTVDHASGHRRIRVEVL